MRKNIVTGIDIGTNSIRVVITELSPETGAPRIIGTGVCESRGMRCGYVVNPQEEGCAYELLDNLDINTVTKLINHVAELPKETLTEDCRPLIDKLAYIRNHWR